MYLHTDALTPAAAGAHFDVPTGDEWLIDGLIPDQAFFAIYGPSKSGKSAFAMQLALHVAAGKPFLGREVKQGTVVYITGDGAKAVTNRTGPIRKYYDIRGDVPFQPVCRFTRVPFYPTFIGLDLSTLPEPHLIVMDGIAGSDRDFVSPAENARRIFGCTVLAIHHSGEEHDRGMQGVTPMLGKVDGAFTVARKGELALVQAIKGASVTAPALEIPVLK